MAGYGYVQAHPGDINGYEMKKRHTEVNSYYLDTATSAPMYECYEKEYAITRKEDCESRLVLLEMPAQEPVKIGAMSRDVVYRA